MSNLGERIIRRLLDVRETATEKNRPTPVRIKSPDEWVFTGRRPALATVTDDHIARANRIIDCGLDCEQVSQWLATHEADKAEIERLQAIVHPINELRREEGDSVAIVCDAPDFDGTNDNNLIVVYGEWCGYDGRQYHGETLAVALSRAVAAREAAKGGEA